MPRPSPHPLALFSLIPFPNDNERAQAVIAHPLNARFASRLPGGILALNVGSQIHGKSSKTLVVIGRGVGLGADIIVEGPSISKIQCSFEIEWNTGVVTLCDRSRGHTTYVLGEYAVPFEHGRLRKLVVRPKLNTIIGMGRGADIVQFELDWHQDLTKSMERFMRVPDAVEEVVENPALAWTTDAAPTEMPSHRETRLHTSGSVILKVRYAKVDSLGSGQFGQVYKAVDVDSGKLMAVKILKRPQSLTKQAEWANVVKKSLKREIETLSSLSHPNIVDYIASQGWIDSDVEIFMGLKEGTVESLIENGVTTVADAIFRDMLQALDCIAHRNIIHRDVKPENILYLSKPNGKYQFQLGDFGLCNRASEARTFSGTRKFMAPEVESGDRQSCKVDVWSLFVTMLWVLDINEFRQVDLTTTAEVHNAVFGSFSDPNMLHLKEMAAADPLQRASAAQMLVKLFDGDGLSTPRNEVQALHTYPPLAVAPAGAVAQNSPLARQVRGKERLAPRRSTRVVAGIRKRERISQMLSPKMSPDTTNPYTFQDKYMTGVW